MDFYLCIGSILVFIGICTLTYAQDQETGEVYARHLLLGARH